MKESRETLLYAVGGAVIGGVLGFVGPDFSRWVFSDSTIPGISEWLQNLARESKLATTVIGTLAGLGLGLVIRQTRAIEVERVHLEENLRQAAILARQERGSAKVAVVLSLATALALGVGVLAPEIGKPIADAVLNLPKGGERIASGVIGAFTNPGR